MFSISITFVFFHEISHTQPITLECASEHLKNNLEEDPRPPLFLSASIWMFISAFLYSLLATMFNFCLTVWQ